jgi:hypothetical protein
MQAGHALNTRSTGWRSSASKRPVMAPLLQRMQVDRKEINAQIYAYGEGGWLLAVIVI